MNYSKEQLKSIEKVKTIFADYIANSKTLDLLWSDKLGYILITGISKDMDAIVMDPEIITDASRLCDQLIYEIACDTLEALGPLHDVHESSPFEQQLIIDACLPYMKHLPEHNSLIGNLFINPGTIMRTSSRT